MLSSLVLSSHTQGFKQLLVANNFRYMSTSWIPSISSQTPLLVKNFINGQHVDSSSDDIIKVYHPATAHHIASIPNSNSVDVNRAVASAQNAFKSFKQTTMEQRSELLFAIATKISENYENLVQVEYLDTGKPVSLVRRLDIARACDNFLFFAGALLHQNSGGFVRSTMVNTVIRKPVGVAALITPWNLPLYLLSWKIAPALAMGNTVVCKPSEITPLSANALSYLIKEAGVPDGIVNIIHGSGASCGDSLVGHPDVGLVSFTGGTETGRRVASVATSSFKKVSLELGGKNPTIIFPDVDIDAILNDIVNASFLNQGQICLCGSRLFIHESIYNEFLTKFIDRVKLLKINDPGQPDTEQGSLVSLQHRAKVESYIKLGIEEGGTILCGGNRLDLPSPFNQGAFLCPTIIGNLSYKSRTATEEIFGPVISVHSFKNEDEVIEMSNYVKYGLSASIWVRDIRIAQRMAHALDAGTVWINCWLARDLRVPFGGVKQSGVGREGGEYSLDFYSEQTTMCSKL